MVHCMSGNFRDLRNLTHRADVVVPFRFIIAPYRHQAKLFIKERIFYPGECKIATALDDMKGYDLKTWEVWWLDRLWPCSTHEDVERMLEMKNYAKFRGADIHHWWT